MRVTTDRPRMRIVKNSHGKMIGICNSIFLDWSRVSIPGQHPSSKVDARSYRKRFSFSASQRNLCNANNFYYESYTRTSIRVNSLLFTIRLLERYNRIPLTTISIGHVTCVRIDTVDKGQFDHR